MTMKQTKLYATERIKALRTTAKPSQFISSLDALEPGPVVLYVRVSSFTHKENLPDQIAKLVAEMEKLGFLVIAIFQEVVPGWEEVRIGFEKAVLKAKDAGAVIVAESVSRYIRILRYRSRRFQPPSVFDMRRLMAEADGVPLATLVHPDAPESEERSEQTKRGQAGKGNYGGRPKEQFRKKAKRLKQKPKAIALRREGFSYRQIGRKLGVHWSTIRDWTKDEKTAHPAATA